MAEITYYVVLPFARNEDGDLVPSEPIEAQSSHGAHVRAQAAAAKAGGAIAFSRTGDPSLGDWADALVIATIGNVPADLMEFTGG